MHVSYELKWMKGTRGPFKSTSKTQTDQVMAKKAQQTSEGNQILLHMRHRHVVHLSIPVITIIQKVTFVNSCIS